MSTEKQKYNSNKDEHLNASLNEISNLKKSFPFSVPENYFEELPSKISSRITEKSESSILSNLLTYLKKPVYAVSTSLALITIVISSVLYFQEKNSGDLLSDEITLEEILKEYPYFYENIYESDIINLLLADTDEEFLNLYLDNEEMESIPDEDIIDYLLDENDNSDLIYNL